MLALTEPTAIAELVAEARQHDLGSDLTEE
jgi:hypothetical protein